MPAWGHRDDLNAYARRLLVGDRASAEDVVQDAYLRLAECEANGTAPDDARPWLFRVVRNLAMDERRRARRAIPTAEPGDDLPGTPPPFEVVAQMKAAEHALREVASLPPRERDAVLMEQAGTPPRRIASELKITPNAVHQALFRARRRMSRVAAAAWGLLPAPVARVMIRVADSPAPQLFATAGTGDGRSLRVAGLVGAGVALLAGGGSALQDGLPTRPDPPPRTAVPANSTAGAASVRSVVTGSAPVVSTAPPPLIHSRQGASRLTVLDDDGHEHESASVDRVREREVDRRDERGERSDEGGSHVSPPAEQAERARSEAPDDEAGRTSSDLVEERDETHSDRRSESSDERPEDHEGAVEVSEDGPGDTSGDDD